MSSPSLLKDRRERGKMGRLSGKMKVLHNTKHTHTHTHTCFQYIVFCISLSLCGYYLYTCSFIHTSHTDTHTFSVYVSLAFVHVSDRERKGGSLSLDIYTYEWVGDREGGKRV